MVSINSSQDDKNASTGEANRSEKPASRKKPHHREPGYISPITIRPHTSRVVEPLAVEIAEYVEQQESPNFTNSLLENSEFTRAKISERFDQFWTSSQNSPEEVAPVVQEYLTSLAEHDPHSREFLIGEIKSQAARIIRIRALEEGVIAEGNRDSGGFSEYKLGLRKPSPETQP